MNRDVTIEVLDESMTAREGKMPRSRPMWCAAGLVVHVKGALPGIKYEQAANLAMAVCLTMNIPAISLRRYSASVTKAVQSLETKSRRMGGF